MNQNEVIYLYKMLDDAIQEFKGKPIKECLNKLGISSTAKNSNAVYFKRMINQSKNGDFINELIKKYNCLIKTITLEWNNNLKESLSLNVINYEEIVNEDWETSTFRNYFIDSSFIFVAFKKGINDIFLDSITIWKMPSSILETGVKSVWLDTKEKIENGKIVNYIDNRNRYITYFLSSSDTKYVHVRPHAQNKSDTLPLPTIDKHTGLKEYTKHSFWLNSNFVKNIVVERKFYD